MVAQWAITRSFIEEDRTLQVKLAVNITYALALVSVALRFVSRRLARSQLWWDDLFVVLAMTTATGSFIVSQLWFDAGLGKHVVLLLSSDPSKITLFLKYLYAQQFLYPFTCFFAKWAIMAFYYRIFWDTWLKKWIHVIAGIHLCWFSCLIILEIRPCWPIAAFWAFPPKLNQCIDIYSFYIGMTVPHIATGIFILGLPVPAIWQMNLPLKDRLAIIGLFGFGGLETIISIIRFVAIIHGKWDDPTWDLVDLILWSAVELNCAVVCACLPSFRPLFRWCTGQPIHTKMTADTHPTPVIEITQPGERDLYSANVEAGQEAGSNSHLVNTIAIQTRVEQHREPVSQREPRSPRMHLNRSPREMSEWEHKVFKAVGRVNSDRR